MEVKPSSKDVLRLSLEEAVIGAILIENRMCDAWILSTKNFKSSVLANIFAACQSIYPNSVIDVISVRKKLLEQKKEVDLDYIYKVCFKLTSPHNTKFNVFQLLEMDIREKFVERLRYFLAKETDLQVRTVLQSFIPEVENESTNILSAVEATHRVMVRLNFPKWIIIDVDKFNTNIEAKVKMMQKNNSITALFFNLEKLCVNSLEDIEMVKKLKRNYI